MSYTPLATSSSGEFLVAEDQSVSRVIPSEWNTTRFVHVAVIVVCIVCTSAAILFAIAKNGESSLKHHGRIVEPPPFTMPPQEDVRNTSHSTTLAQLVTTTANYSEAKAEALEDSGLLNLDALPHHIPAYEHVASLMNQNKSALVVFFGVATGAFVLFGGFLAIAMYKKHVREMRAIDLEKISRELNADHLRDIEFGDEEELLVGGRIDQGG